ncbi:MAG: GNAT family N-acetyltransferase [Acidimicrobiia bacterium]|nr:GNAT family N-acetyltransferase [Acidimicrobiia bacterium]
MTEPRRADKTDRAAAAATLGAAFLADPLMSWIRRSNAGERHLRAYFRAELGAVLSDSDHLTFVTPDVAAVAMWRDVDKWKPGFTEIVRMLPAGLRGFRSRAGIRAIQRIEKAHPREHHYYLETLGTHPGRQGEGLGGSLVSVMTDRADAEGLPCYLESSNPENEPFYMRKGFEVREELDLGKGAPVFRTMWREPREPDQS